MFEDVQAFIAALERAGELKRIAAPVSPVLEIAAVADRVSKSRAPSLPVGSARRADPRFHHLGGSALLFESVEGSDMPVLINSMGSYRRMEMALGCHDSAEGAPEPRVPGGFEGWADRIAALVEPKPPASIGEFIRKARELSPLLRMPPKKVRTGLCQEVVLTGDRVDLSRLPIIKCWPLDGDLDSVGWPSDINGHLRAQGLDMLDDPSYRGRYITLAGIHTIHADDLGNPRPPSRNIGMYRVQLLGRRRVAMHWHMHHDGARHWRSWKKRGERMPVAIVLGGESVLPYAATAPLPPGLSEILLAGFLNGRGIPMVACKTVPLSVPANAEIVIEGWVSHEAGMIGFERPGKASSPDAAAAPPPSPARGGGAAKAAAEEADAYGVGPGAVIEGPFGDHTGFYSLPDRYPIVAVTAITMRKRPVYPTTIVGLPPQEDYYLGKATERIFLPLLKTLIHDIEDYDLPMFGAFHNCAFVKIKKEYPLQARRVMHSVWGAGQMAWTKHVVVVDDGVDVHDHAAVLRAVGECCDPSRDIETVRGPLDILDHAAPVLGGGTKLGFDATRRFDAEKTIGAAASPRRDHRDDRSPAVDAGIMSPPEVEALLRVVSGLPGVAEASMPEELARRWLFVRVADSGRGPERLGWKAIEAMDAALERMGAAPPFAVVVSEGVDISAWDEAMFHWCASSDPGRDRTLIAGRRTCVFDATGKDPSPSVWGYPVREYPPLLCMPEEVVRRVDARWKEFGLG